MINEERKTEKWMNIKVTRANGMKITGGMILCACSDGIIRVFDCLTLQHILTLPKPPPLGKANWYIGEQVVKVQKNEGMIYSDATSLAMDLN